MINYVTGSSGFLGKHLVRKLNHRTITIPYSEIATYKFEDFERFFFLSAYGNMATHQDKNMIVRANVLDIGRVLDYLMRFNVEWKSFVFVSSSSVTLPVQTAYSRSKRAAEEMILASGLPICIVRPFSIIGVGEQRDHLIPTLIRSCVTGSQMDFVPDATHDYVDVDDVVDGMLMLSDKKETGIFEFGKGVEVSNAEIKEVVEQACGAKANVRVVESLRSYDNDSWFCKEPAKGWKPKKTLEKSIEEMVADYVS